MKKVLYVSGTRADYGPFRSTLQAINTSPMLDLSILVTGMHLLPRYGTTLHEIERDGFKIAAQVPMAVEGSTGTVMAMSMGLGMIGMAQALERIAPDQVIVLGDRTEMLAAPFWS
jgi:UDP-N-acetylglucosamine 2-epimerase